MNLDELQSVQSRERQTDQLQQLRPTFYEESGEFVQQLREERDRAADRADDPFDSPEVNRLTDDIKTAEQTVEAIYERRVGKIVKMASLAAADMPTEDDGLTQEERDLFETMVGAIESNRSHVLDVIAGEAPTGTVGDSADTGQTETAPTSEQRATGETATADAAGADSSTPETDTDTGVGAADVMGGEQSAPSPPTPPASEEETAGSATPDEPPVPPEEPPGSGRHDGEQGPAETAAAGATSTDGQPADGPSSETQSDHADVDRRTVRITDDVGEIFGVDQREYDLSTDDVVTLPADNADPLVEQDAAEPLE